jgi:hypothetical protein
MGNRTVGSEMPILTPIRVFGNRDADHFVVGVWGAMQSSNAAAWAKSRQVNR